MSFAGQIEETVKALVEALTGGTDKRLDALEERVTALETPPDKGQSAESARTTKLGAPKVTGRVDPGAVKASARPAGAKGSTRQ